MNLGIPYAAFIWKSSLTQRNWWTLCFQCLRRIELILHIRKELEEGKLPADVASSLEELYYNYKNAVKLLDLIFVVFLLCYCQIVVAHVLQIFCYQVLQTGNPDAYEIMLSNMMALFDRVILDVQVLPPILISYFLHNLLWQFCSRSQIVSLIELHSLQNPFTFPPYHKAIREPFDYYMFGQNYIRPLVDFR